jgi:ribonuclease P protein component
LLRGARVVASDSPSSSANTFVDAARLRRSVDIAAVRSDGMKIQHSLFALRARPNGLESMRIAVSSPRSVGGAVKRNRARRRVRDAFTAETHVLAREDGHDLLVVARAGAIDAPYGAIREAARVALRQLSPARTL